MQSGVCAKSATAFAWVAVCICLLGRCSETDNDVSLTIIRPARGAKWVGGRCDTVAWIVHNGRAAIASLELWHDAGVAPLCWTFARSTGDTLWWSVPVPEHIASDSCRVHVCWEDAAFLAADTMCAGSALFTVLEAAILPDSTP
jgi:hypothetical protein